MRRLRIRIRLKRPSALRGMGPEDPSGPPADTLPGRDFPPVPDGRAVPGPPAPSGELPAREGPGSASSSPRRPVVRVDPAMAKRGEQVPAPGAGSARRRSRTPVQPALLDLGPAPAGPVSGGVGRDSTKAPPQRAVVEPEAPPAPPAMVNSRRTRGQDAESSSSCPACGQRLAERPHMKTVCPACGKGIHVRGGQAIFPHGLVPEDEVDAVDLMERLEPLGITQDECLKRLERDERGRPRAGALGALLRELCEERLPELLPATQVRLLHEMARERQWRSEDPRPLLRRAQVILLQKMRTAGVTRVRVACSGSDACPACRELTGRSLSISDALAQQMLPNADCRHPGGLCRCRYTEAENEAGAAG